MRLSVSQLRAILRTHQILDVGTKEELIARVGLLKAGYPEAAFSRERLCILHIIEVAKLITRTQGELDMTTVRRRRTFAHGKENTVTTRTSCLKDILSPTAPSIEVKNKQKRNVEDVLDALKVIVTKEEEMSRQRVDELEKKTSKLCDEKQKVKKTTACKSKRENIAKVEVRNENTRQRSERKKKLPAKLREGGETEMREHFSVGQTVEVLWNEKDLEGTSWKPGWYRGEIQRFDEEDDIIYIWYFKDHSVFGLDASGSLVDGIIRRVNEP